MHHDPTGPPALLKNLYALSDQLDGHHEEITKKKSEVASSDHPRVEPQSGSRLPGRSSVSRKNLVHQSLDTREGGSRACDDTFFFGTGQAHTVKRDGEGLPMQTASLRRPRKMTRSKGFRESEFPGFVQKERCAKV